MGPILYLTACYPTWSETFIAQELTLLRAQGLPLLPVAIRRGPGELAPAWRDCLFLDDRPPATGPEPPPRWRPALPAALQRQFALERHRVALRRLCDLAAEHQVCHLHAAFADLPGLLVAKAAQRLDLGYSVSVHAADALSDKYDGSYILRRADRVFSCNHFAAGVLWRRHPWLGSKLTVVPHGLCLEHWPSATTPWTPGEPWRLLFVGRLVPKKAPERLLAILRGVLAAGQAATLTIAGDGPLRAELEQTARGLPMRFIGVLPRSEIRQQMLAHDCLISCSRETANDAEGVPNVILEAMACGLPVMATHGGGVREALLAETGFLLDEPEQELPPLLASLRANPEPARQRARAARQMIEQHWDALPLAATKAQLLRQAAELI
jgi:glycosyltransferase involved in cell wall biosynthesis